MKTEESELPTVTYKQAVEQLNGLCDGLGDELMQLEPYETYKHNQNRKLSTVVMLHWWYNSELGLVFWDSIYDLLLEIEDGAGIKN